MWFLVLTNHIQVLYLSVPKIQEYWAKLLQICRDNCAQEHPLYALHSSILSTLSNATCTAGDEVSPTSIYGPIFSYPQCRVVDRTTVGESEYSSLSVYPDFALMHSATGESPGDGGMVEEVKLLIEVKQLYSLSACKIWSQKSFYFLQVSPFIHFIFLSLCPYD